MAELFKIFQDLLTGSLFTSSGKQVYSVGPNNLNELLKQFDQPKKEKTQEEIERDYKIKLKMHDLELFYLKGNPSIDYLGSYKSYNNDSTIDIDFVPVSVRPEVIYCNNGLN